jgi:coenzyme F420-reducing hydrogenase beta subunit
MQELIVRAKELLASGEVARVLGWKKGEHSYDPEVAFFNDAESLKDFVYDGFCGANLSKYMIEASKLEGKTLVFLKPCDSYSFVQLMKEHRVDQEKAYIIGVGCWGKLDVRKLGTEGILDVEIAGDVLKVSSLYGDSEIAYKDAML